MDDSMLLASAASVSVRFDAFAWVEDALSSRSGEASALVSLVPQLALRAQTLAQTLHASLQQVSRVGPVLQTHLQGLQQDTAPLHRHLNKVQHEACALDSIATASSAASDHELRHLVTLHEAKRRLKSCSQALVDAATWGRNVRACFAALEDPMRLSHAMQSGISTVRTSSDVDPLAGKVRELQTSRDVLKDLPGAEDRQRTMERLCVQMEAAVLPLLASMLRHDDLGDVAPLRWCLDVLGSVDRAHLVNKEFCRARPARVHRVWDAYSDDMQSRRDETDGKEDAFFATWLEHFYRDVLQMLQRERRSIREVFGADMLRGILFVLLRNTLEPRTTSFRDRLVHSSSSGSAFCLGWLRCFYLTRGFAGHLVRFFKSLEDEVGANVTERDDRAASADGILRVVFEPYRLYFTEYTCFASNALTDALLRLVPSFNVTNNHEVLDTEEYVDGDRDAAAMAPLEDFSQRLEGVSEAVWMLVEESLQQCYEFTGGAAFPEAIEAVGAAVQQFTLALAATMTAIRKYCKAEPTVQGAATGSMVASPDWSQFHASLALLKACGTLESQLCTIDSRLRVRMREQLAQFFGRTSESSSPRSRRKEVHDGSRTALADLMDPTKLVAAVSKAWLHEEDPTRQSRLYQFEMELLDHSAEPPGFGTAVSHYPTAKMLDESQQAVRSWTREVQLLTHDTVFLPIVRVLDTLSVNVNWCKVPDAALGDLPTFSMLPQDYITMVADLLLSLLPQLEPFAQSGSLESAFVASRGAHEACIQGEWTRLGHILQLTPAELLTCQRLFGSHGKSAVSEEPVPMATEFVDLWTTAVASSTLAAFLRTVCSISMLSEMGAQQLATDLGYFHNVLSAVGGESNFIVNDLRCALEMDLQAHVHHVEELRADCDSPEKQALAKLNGCIVAMRQRALEQSAPTVTPASADSTPASSQLFQ